MTKALLILAASISTSGRAAINPQLLPARNDFKATGRVLLINGMAVNSAWSGTGFLVSMPDGSIKILTNKHVCHGGVQFTAKFESDLVFRPIQKLRESTSKSDLCLLDPGADIDTSAGGYVLAQVQPQPGTHITSYGFPMRMPLSQNDGVIKEYVRLPSLPIDIFSGMLLMRTTTPNIPGASGSPVLDKRGELVGVVCAIENPMGEHPTGMAVPLTSVKQFLFNNQPKETLNGANNSGLRSSDSWNSRARKIFVPEGGRGSPSTR